MVHLGLEELPEEWMNHNWDNISTMHPQAVLQEGVEEVGIRELDALPMPDHLVVRNTSAGLGSYEFEQDEKHACGDDDSFD
jgi:hypothetical protein